MNGKISRSLRIKAKRIIGTAPFQIPPVDETTDKRVIKNEYKMLKKRYKELPHNVRGQFNAA